ncbi:hypothetical protein V6Z11_D07G123300 [Gossypium hirsutum]
MMSKMKAFLMAIILLVFTLLTFTAPASARSLAIHKKSSYPLPKPTPSHRCSRVRGKRVCVGY